GSAEGGVRVRIEEGPEPGRLRPVRALGGAIEADVPTPFPEAKPCGEQRAGHRPRPLRRQLDDADRVPTEPVDADPDPPARSGQERRLAPVPEAEAVVRDVLDQQD